MRWIVARSLRFRWLAVFGAAALSQGPPAGTEIVTTGSAELLATEYEILNQHP